jgi:hypothetical protein
MASRVQSTPVLVALYLAAVFFPYIALLPLQTDVQPYAVVLATLLVIWSADRRIPWLLYGLLIPPAAAIVFVIIAHFSFYAVRALVGYWSLFAHATAGYLVFQRHSRAVVRWMSVTSWVWLAVAIAQQFVAPDLTRLLIPNVSVDPDRGVSSLATEPSFYGLYCFFMLLLARVIAWEPIYFRASLFTQILIMARSGMGALALAILLGARAIVHLKKAHLVMLALVVGALIVIVHELPEDLNARAFFLLVTAVTDPSSLLAGDTSVNARVNHVIYSIRGFVESFGAPHGFDAFSAYIGDLQARDPDMIWLGADPAGLRIMSGYGGVLFELGWFGLVIPFVLTAAAWRRFKDDRTEFVAFAVALNAVMFAAVQISLPLIGFIAGVSLAQSRRLTRGEDTVISTHASELVTFGDPSDRKPTSGAKTW